MAIHLSDHFTYSKLLRFTLPAIGSMLLTSVYSVVDGFFVSNFVGKTAFAAITIIFPLLAVLGAAGLMFGAGGSALVGKKLGQGKRALANEIFSLLVYTTIVIGILASLLGFLVLEPIATKLGATGETFDFAVCYGQISLCSLPAFMLQFFFQALFVTSEKPKLGFYVTVLAGCTNMVLDAVFILVFSLGLPGAALATVASECVAGFLPLVYFARKNTSLLRLGAPGRNLRAILRACGNGSSEFLINVAYPLLIVCYTIEIMPRAGEDGIAAFGVLLYVSFVFHAFFLGYAQGAAPLVSYAVGARATHELTNLFTKSCVLNLFAGLFFSLLDFCAAGGIAVCFTGYDPTLCELTRRALRCYAPVFLLSALNIYGSSLFTAMNNGIVSAALSLLRSLLGVVAIFVLPPFFGLDGVWFAWSCAEALTLVITLWLFRRVFAP